MREEDEEMAQKIEMTENLAPQTAGKLRFEGTVELGGAVSDQTLSVLFGPESTVDGKLDFDGAVRIDGTFRGSIRTSALVVGEHANITADVTCTTAVIHGEITGNVTASEHVSLESGARVKGDISSPSLSLAKGAMFDGLSRMGTLPRQKRPNRT